MTRTAAQVTAFEKCKQARQTALAKKAMLASQPPEAEESKVEEQPKVEEKSEVVIPTPAPVPAAPAQEEEEDEFELMDPAEIFSKLDGQQELIHSTTGELMALREELTMLKTKQEAIQEDIKTAYVAKAHGINFV